MSCFIRFTRCTQWDIGEFDQKGSIPTRWGTREELLEACSAARQYNIGVIIDAVLNVILLGLFLEPSLTSAHTSTNLALIDQKRFPLCPWIQRTAFVLWNRSVKSEYVDVHPHRYLALASGRAGQRSTFLDDKAR